MPNLFISLSSQSRRLDPNSCAFPPALVTFIYELGSTIGVLIWKRKQNYKTLIWFLIVFLTDVIFRFDLALTRVATFGVQSQDAIR